jgi:hypothetical protein
MVSLKTKNIKEMAKKASHQFKKVKISPNVLKRVFNFKNLA